MLPELATSGYVFESAAEVRALAQAADSTTLAEWAQEAARADAVVVAGFCELGGDGRVYNSAAVVDRSGVLAVYRKAHLWDRESLFFAPGREPPPVVETSIGRIGLAVCYDLFFPEVPRALAGADVIVIPTNSPTTPANTAPGAPPSGKEIGIAIAVTTAYLNRVFLTVCDRCGPERGVDWSARTVIVDPDGRTLAAASAPCPEIVVAQCDLKQARDKRWAGSSNDAFLDRRPELYALAAADGNRAPLGT